MNIITKKRVHLFMQEYPDEAEQLEVWLKIIGSVNFKHLPDLRSVFPTADLVGQDKDLCCFNIKGNKYRLIVRMSFPKTVFIKDFLPHDEYDKKYPY